MNKGYYHQHVGWTVYTNMPVAEHKNDDMFQVATRLGVPAHFTGGFVENGCLVFEYNSEAEQATPESLEKLKQRSEVVRVETSEYTHPYRY